MDNHPSVTVVLVHGNFLGPWSWRDVAAQLGDDGVDTVIAELPSSADTPHPLNDLHDDARAVRRILDAAVGPVILCGHSYGGAVITEAAAGPHPAVRRLVYLAGAVPDTGESLTSLAPASESAKRDDVPGEEVTFRTDGRIELSPDAANATLFHDCAPERARRALRQLRPSNPITGAQQLRDAAWRELPATYVRCTDDRLPELVTASFAPTDTVELPTGHCPNWSAPGSVAALLRKLSEQAVQ